MAEALSWVSRFFVAVFSAPIFPSSFIEPVLSSTSATRRRVLPHAEMETPLIGMSVMPNPGMPMNMVFTLVAPVTVTCGPVLVIA